MNSKEQFKDIFILAVRLGGLYFIFLGLRDLDVPAFTDVTILKGDNVDDVISTLLPVGYNLAVGWGLLGCAFLGRRAYPESSKTSGRFPPSGSPVAPATPATPADPLTEMQTAEKKLAALVANPKAGPAAKDRQHLTTP